MPEQLPSTTTVEQNLRTAGQRRINLIWEYTQAFLAVAVVLSVLFVAVLLALQGTPDLQQIALVMLASQASLITGFYFGRTNHARIGDEPKIGLDDR